MYKKKKREREEKFEYLKNQESILIEINNKFLQFFKCFLLMKHKKKYGHKL